MGLALLPSNIFHNTVIANKVIHYASCGLPSLMIDNEKNHSIFDESVMIHASHAKVIKGTSDGTFINMICLLSLKHSI